MESTKIWLMREKSLTSIQDEFVIGTLLGDGYLMPTTRGCCLRIHHGDKQRKYIQWKYKIMKSLVNTPPKIDGKSYYFRTVSNSVFDKYRNMFYEKNRKKVPKDIEQLLTPLGLAVWIMDDGSRDRGCMRISSHNFSYEEHIILREVLRAKFGIKANIQKAQDKFWLWLTYGTMPKLTKLIRPYFIPSMLYKLPRNDYPD